ncbi:MAG: hypothetical protein P4L57_10380 [Rhizomicrobium sp.]|nr:hypothetical protein [Rhizomicrobium sp.]
MKRVIIALVLCLAGLVPARAQFTDLNSVGHWMTYYYVDKDVSQVGAYVHWLAASDFSKSPNSVMPMTSFLAAVFVDNPTRVRGWVADVAPNSAAKNVIERALWLSGHADLIKDVFHDAPDYVAQQPASFATLPLTTPGSWDVMWSAFFATGNTAYPARLVDFLDAHVSFSANEKVDAVFHRTVAWSLMANAGQHELILRMLRQEAQKRSGPVQQTLKAMVARIDGQHLVMPNCDDGFCATLNLISEENLKELDKPFDQVPILTELHQVKPGDHVAVNISFAGIALADDLSTDVVYDIQTFKPDGTLYEAEHKDLVALKRKVPQRFVVFDNRPEILLIRFEPQDPRGTYRIEVVVKDKIGGKSLKLAKAITLKD